MFMGLWRCVPFSFSIFSLPEFPTPHDTIFIQETSEHNSYDSVISQTGTSSWEHLGREEYQDNTSQSRGEICLDMVKDWSYFFFTPFCRLDYNKFLMRVHLLLKRLFFSMWVFGSIVEGQMGVAAWIDFWVFDSTPSVYMSELEPAPYWFFSPMTL